MARLIPQANPSAIPLDPERRVAEALVSQLPAKAMIFHSYPWLRPERDLRTPKGRTALREGEADFVVLHPRYGIAVVEVKGGQMSYDPATRNWSRERGTHPVKDPFEQASKSRHVLEDQIRTRSFGGYHDLPFSRAHCVVFPHCDFAGSLPPGAHPSMLFGASDLGRLGEKLEDLFKLQPFVPKTGLSTEILNGLSQGLTSTFQLLPALWCELEDQERKLIRMTEDQLDVLAMLEAHPRVTIQGVAGSGKTVLAMSKAREFADRGGNVLFLCFNEMLAEWLRAALPSSYEGRVTVRNYHKLCSEWAKAAGIPWPKNTDSMFFSREAPQLLEQAIDLLPERCFDAVVVDEGQDFQPGWWDTVELLNKRPCEGSLYIFFDPDQQVFHESLAAMPRLSGPFKLPVNCRNTKQIASRCGSILSKIIPVKAGSPDGRKPKFIHAQSSEEQIREADRQVAEWTGTPSRLRLGQIAVVTRGSLQASSLAGVAKLADQPVTNDLKVWRDNRGILLTSLYRFKGLEADALILADVIPPDPMAPLGGFRPEHFYVGCSRAKHLLTIISYSEDWE